MTATDELRRMLDERGVEWCDSSDENVLHTTWNDMNCWFNEFPDGWTAWGMAKRGTPEQAIAATLGNGECELEPIPSIFVTLNMLNEIGWGKCSECGHATPDESNYCQNCGKAVKHG